jgi:ribosomal protein L40E
MTPKDDIRVNLSVDGTDSPSRIKCLECGSKNPPNAEFCTKCRAKLILTCAHCGFKNPQHSEFCGGCGATTEFGRRERQRKTERASEKAADSAYAVGLVKRVVLVPVGLAGLFLAMVGLSGLRFGLVQGWLTDGVNLGLLAFGLGLLWLVRKNW